MLPEQQHEVLVASFRSSDEARAGVRALAGGGIESRIATDDALRLAQRDLVPFLGIGILVDAADETAARTILEEVFAESAPQEVPPERCPACGSSSFRRLHRLAIFGVAAAAMVTAGFAFGELGLFMLTLGIVGALLLATPNRRCTSCGERWRGTSVVVEEEPRETPEVPCPRCGSSETFRIDRRRLRAITLIVNIAVPPFFVFWPLLPKRRCERCGNEWR